MKTMVFSLSFLVLVSMQISCERKAEISYNPSFSSDEPKLKKKIIIFGVHPLHNPERLFEKFSPLMSYLETQIPDTKFELEASKDYQSFEKKLEEKKFDIALPNPYQTIKAVKHGYQVFAKMNDDENFRGIILVKKDGPIKNLEDLKHKVITFPAKTALAASMMPQYYLYQKGFDLKKDFTIKYVGSQESSILSVFHNESSAGATWPGAWNLFKEDRPEIASKLKELARTDSLPSNSLIASNNLDPLIIEKIKKAILDINANSKGEGVLKKLQLSKFVGADNSTYKTVEEFIEKFEAAIERIENK